MNRYKISLNIVFVIKLWSILAILWSILPILWSILSILWSILPYLWSILFCCLSNIAKTLSPFIDQMCMCKTCSKTNKKGSFGNFTKVTCSYYIKDLHIFLKHRRYICKCITVYWDEWYFLKAYHFVSQTYQFVSQTYHSSLFYQVSGSVLPCPALPARPGPRPHPV